MYSIVYPDEKMQKYDIFAKENKVILFYAPVQLCTVVVDAFPTMYVSLRLSFSHSFAAGTVTEYSKAPGRRF